METNNIFIKYIYESKRKRFKFFHWIRFLFLIHRLNNTTPSYNLMLQMCDFIKALEITYLYPNNTDCNIFTVKCRPDESALCVKANKYTRVLIILGKVDNTNHIRIQIITGDKKRSEISFKEGEAKIENIHDEQLFININDWIMNTFVKLLVEYYG